MKEISDRDLTLPELEFPGIFKRVVTDKSIISLGPGEPDFETPKPILDHAKKVIGNATHYSQPQGSRILREGIVKKLSKENGIKKRAEEVAIGCGSQELLFASLLTVLDPRDEIIIPTPGYLGYLPAVHLVSAKTKFLKLEEEDEFAINPDKLRKLANKKRTKALIINSPSNPTGNVLTRKQLEEIADVAVDKDIYVLSDEAYEQLTYERKAVSFGSLNGMENYAITFQTFSKSFAMCGFRVGYCAGPKKFIDEMTQAHHYITLTAPHISQLAAIKALTISKKYVNEMVRRYRRRRDFIVKRLNSLGLTTIKPQGAFYTFSNISKYSKSASGFARMLLDKAGVAVIPGTEFGPGGEGYIRCSFATKYEKIVKAMDKIEKVLNGGRS